MLGIGKHKFLKSAIITIVSLAFITAAFSARIIPAGKVSIIKEGEVVGEFSQESPLPEGSMLRCEDKCTVKLDDTYMVVDGGTEFSLTPMADQTRLYVKAGTVYFSINDASRPIQIATPNGDAATGDLTMAEDEVKGYVRVSGNKTEIGVIGGGTMMVETASGEMAVAPGKQVNIAMVNQDVSAGGDEGGSSSIRNIALYAAEAAVLVGGIYLLTTIDGNSGSNGSNDGSPSSP